MFEREFEIVVPQDFETCLERIDTLKMPGCLSGLFNQSIGTFVYLREKDAQFVLRQWLGRNAGYAVIKGIVEPLDADNTIVTGVAHLEGIILILILFSVIAFAFIVQSVASTAWVIVGFNLIWFTLAVYQQFYYRNRLIKVLEKALRQ